jgi:hypothetical protein
LLDPIAHIDGADAQAHDPALIFAARRRDDRMSLASAGTLKGSAQAEGQNARGRLFRKYVVLLSASSPAC